jgi:hypothetical protein
VWLSIWFWFVCIQIFFFFLLFNVLLSNTVLSSTSLFTYLVGLGFKLRTSWLQNKSSTTWTSPPVHFALVILKMESLELFAQAGFKPRPSWSQSPRCESLVPSSSVTFKLKWPSFYRFDSHLLPLLTLIISVCLPNDRIDEEITIWSQNAWTPVAALLTTSHLTWVSSLKLPVPRFSHPRSSWWVLCKCWVLIFHNCRFILS